MFIVKLNKASSASGVAYVGPQKSSGFKVDDIENAHRFEAQEDAATYADSFKNKWRGFYGFSPSDIEVVVA